MKGHGRRLGPVGGRIVGEVIHGLIDGDPQPDLRQDPDWTRAYGTGNDFQMTDLPKAAGVVGAF